MATNESSEPQSLPQGSIQPSRAYEMELNPIAADEDSTTIWDWDNFLDFDVDEHITFPFDSDHQLLPMPLTAPVPEISNENQNGAGSDSNSDRIRKRDPRLVCENFLAGRVPCACPEMDAMLEENDEEEDRHGKKKARMARAPSGTARCQVPGCEVDIKELKGYHRRHRVCLKCANASEVLIHEQSKRYCQQCGKFHILSDFDEGKRSCRRKLERHNNRRRRKSVGAKDSNEKESRVNLVSEEISSDLEGEKEKDFLFESEDGKVSILGSTPSSENVQGGSFVSFLTTQETQANGGNDHLKYAISSSYNDNKADHSSTCPTGRISFKLYDWNPAEFPRQLRLQIFEWLAGMPVELEGYIRPGCTILTAFIAMPKANWVKLLENPASYLHDFIIAPGMMLSGKGSVRVYINDMIFLIIKDGTSVKKIKEEVRAPKIHSVHPICFEAGKPMKFVTCGSNLFHPKFRFLVSFSGKYLKTEYCTSYPRSESDEGSACSFDHQLCEIFVPHVEADLFGPAFVEVENEFGLSNFVPILIGDKEVCSEMEKIQQNLDASMNSKPTLRSEVVLDIAWLLKKPDSDTIIQNRLTPSQIRRYDSLLNFLICNDSITILGKVLQILKDLMDRKENLSDYLWDVDVKSFRKRVNYADDILHERLKKKEDKMLKSCSALSLFNDHMLPVVSISNQRPQDIDTRSDTKLMTDLPFSDETSSAPLLNKDVIVNVRHIKELQRPTNSFLGSRAAIFLIVCTLVCFGVCAILLHPHNVGRFAVSVRRCIFNGH